MTWGCEKAPEDPPDSGGGPSALLSDMVLVPAGDFLMGSNRSDAGKDQQPLHKVYVSSFYMDRTAVTNLDYQKFVLETGHPPPRVNTQWARPFNWNGTAFPDGMERHPVVLVSWIDATAYARWAGKRLPTEAEWEKAARGGLVGQKYPYGNRLEFSQASYNKGYIRSKKLMPVGSYPANGYGLFDMAGNVWQWCSDWYGEHYYEKAQERDPSGPEEGFYRVFRGGSWMNDKKFLLCAQRGKNSPEYKSYTTGFRCCLSADPLAGSVP